MGKNKLSIFIRHIRNFLGKYMTTSFNSNAVTYPTISNLEYEPTVGCRIIECQFAGTSIELWDTSGNMGNRSGWLAIKENIDGIIMVYDAKVNTSSQEDDLLTWYNEFCKTVPEDRLLILAHTTSGDPTETFESTKTAHCFTTNIVHHTSFSRTNELLLQVEKFFQSILLG